MRRLRVLALAIAVVGGTLLVPTASADAATTTYQAGNAQTVTTTLSAGTHTVRATATVAAGGPNVDELTVTDSGGGGGGGAPTAQELLAKVTTCSQISNGKYKTDSETGRTIPVCGKN